jgi:nicotinamide-nucleotide amidase
MNLDATLDQVLIALRSKHWTLGFAESCTGGLMSSTLTARAGVSDVFLGSVVSYANSIKTEVLQVSEATLSSDGAVSTPTVIQMAQGAQHLLKCHCVVSVSGVAGPSGGSVDKPVGTVCLAVLGPGFEYAVMTRFSGDRNEIQRQSVNKGFELLLQHLLQPTARP